MKRRFGGFPGGMGGMNMSKLLKEAQKMQSELQKSQEEISSKTFEATAGGAVKVIMTGKRKLEKIEINQDIIDSGDKEMLEDLIMVSINDVLNKIEQEEKSVTDGLNIPGLGL
ncbi:MAG: YbaB/EbfC family nucleoid-associated protein [Clostridium sp.]